MIPSPNHQARGTAKVRLIVVHTAEGARTVESLGSYFSKASVQASSHAGIDDHRVELYVPYDRASWTLRSGNAISDNVELCAFAAWNRDEWLRHPKMLELCAGWIRERCNARGVPIRKLSPAEVKAGQTGVCGHIDWTTGMRDGSHTDPGPGFPWDVVIDLANRLGGAPATPAPAPQPERLSTAQVLAAHGIQRPAEVVELAAQAGLELAAACAMLEKESSGGLNIWGHDGTDTGGFYTKGGPVTRENYLAWKPNRSRLGSQGVGPTQLTYGPTQDLADNAGGCWDWRVNCLTGFQVLAGGIRSAGLRFGFRGYNGGPNPTGAKKTSAEAYADDAMARYNIWRTRLAGATTEEDDMTPEQDRRLARVEDALEILVQQVCGEAATIENPFPGEAKGGGWLCEDGKRRTLVDIGRWIGKKVWS